MRVKKEDGEGDTPLGDSSHPKINYGCHNLNQSLR